MKTKMKLIGMAGTLVFLVGCASNAEYYAAIQHANEQNAQIEIARAQAETERMKALQSIAFSGDETAQTAAVMGLTFAGQQSGGSGQGTGSVAPRQPESTGVNKVVGAVKELVQWHHDNLKAPEILPCGGLLCYYLL